MALTTTQNAQSRRDFVDRLNGSPCKFTKPDLDAAITAVDAWCTTNQASFVAALPEPFKTNSTASEKAYLLAIVAIRRYGG